MLRRLQQGFTMLEVVLAVSIVAIVAGMAAGYYGGVFRSISMESIRKTIISDLRVAQAQSVNGEFAMKWGIHFVNGPTHYYEMFRTPTNYADGAKVVTQSIELPLSIVFTDPSSNSTKDVIFTRTTGLTDATTVVIQDANSGSTQTITISADGIIQ